MVNKKTLTLLFVAFLIVGGGATAVAQDDPKEAQELERNCDAGDFDACYKLGNKFRFGEDANIPKDLDRAVLLFQKACDGEIARSCSWLGMIYLE